MTDTPPIASARQFIDALTQGRPPTGRELLKLLDALASDYHATPTGDPSDEDAPKGIEYQQRCAHLRTRFPQYGYYDAGDPTDAGSGASFVGDAIDDLADIWSDLEQVLWRFDNASPDDGHWHFRFLFEIHWGMHLRQLAVYLHANELRAGGGN